ncbi:VOC family protein [Chromobacterium phragmitis]|uniref:VOC family protein n=1 Tax=Chromobacterium phragmitis TaxID=2202141 RepID=A0ABV0IWC5_9NEIS
MISHIDHIVLTVRDIEAAAAFYQRALKLEAVTFGNGRRALRFGNQKINLQILGQETRNHATIGCGDLCLIASVPLPEVIQHLKREGVAIVEGPITRSGAMGSITLVYFNDPDGNLVEVSSYSF